VTGRRPARPAGPGATAGPPPAGPPVETIGQARRLPAVRAAAEAAASPGGGRQPANYQLLDAACAAAGLDLGGFEHHVLTWLSRAEPEDCGVIANLITRAHAAGSAAAPAGGGAVIGRADVAAILTALDDAVAWRQHTGRIGLVIRYRALRRALGGDQLPAPGPVPAAAIRAGDVLLLDGRQVTVTATSPSRRTDLGVLTECLAIEWSAGSARGVLRRRGAETVDRLRGR